MIDRPYTLQTGPNHCLLTDSPDLPSDLAFVQPPGEIVRVILLGSPGGINQTRHLLHNLNYVEVNQSRYPAGQPRRHSSDPTSVAQLELCRGESVEPADRDS